ncbi:hypothetical protein [uncultured Hyphomonas sp.]|uniref:hypothetical protein n=1 Tax=uncultured Hyphomonas sp. TaxID=225298 RepID=UPI002AAC1726|nr:hypothetical protein [uncultured Hyphomonas sp.]
MLADEKNLKILNCILGLLLGLFPSLVNGKNAICEMKAPASCYRAVAIASGTGQQRKEGGSAPLKHCKTSADTDRLFGLKDGSVLSAVSTSLNVDDVATKSGMRKLQQALLISCKDHPNKSCAPTDGEEVAENNANPVNGALKIKCNPDLLSDGKYGICTAEAVRRYIEYIKATTKKCDSEITVTLTPPSGDIIENKDTVIEVVATKSGDVYTWDNKTEFTTKKMDSIVLENAHFTVVDHDDIAIDNQDITVGTPTKISGKFPAGEIKNKSK